MREKIETSNIYLGCVSENKNFKGLTLCTSIGDHIVDFSGTIYPKIGPSYVDRGVLNYNFLDIMKIINLKELFGYKKITLQDVETLQNHLSSDFVENIINKQEKTIDQKRLSLLKEIYTLLKVSEKKKEEKKIYGNHK